MYLLFSTETVPSHGHFAALKANRNSVRCSHQQKNIAPASSGKASTAATELIFDDILRQTRLNCGAS